jgi:hypothetical protein
LSKIKKAGVSQLEEELKMMSSRQTTPMGAWLKKY